MAELYGSNVAELGVFERHLEQERASESFDF